MEKHVEAVHNPKAVYQDKVNILFSVSKTSRTSCDKLRATYDMHTPSGPHLIRVFIMKQSVRTSTAHHKHAIGENTHRSRSAARRDLAS